MPRSRRSLERELLSVAGEAARAAAAELMSRFGHHQAEIRSKSSPTDLVSEADVAAETAIRAVLGGSAAAGRDPRRGGRRDRRRRAALGDRPA